MLLPEANSRLLIEDVKEIPESKVNEDKGKQVLNDEYAEQCQLAAKLTEAFSKMKPEQPESSRARGNY